MYQHSRAWPHRAPKRRHRAGHGAADRTHAGCLPRLHGRVPGVVQLPNLGSLQVQTVRVDSPRVSGNHLLIWNRSGLGLAAGPGESQWLLAAAGGRAAYFAVRRDGDYGGSRRADSCRVSPLSLPEDADWNNEKQFSAAVVRALTEWLGRLGVSARIVHVTQTRTEESESSFLLADDTTLQVRGMETITQDFRGPRSSIASAPMSTNRIAASSSIRSAATA